MDEQTAPTQAVEDHFQRWFRIGTGCFFAASIASKGGVVYEIHDAMPPVAELDRNLEIYAAQGRTVMIVFPFITTERGVLAALDELRSGSDKWKVTRRPAPAGVARVGVEWRTASGELADAMGFGPILTMPVPRRAPYVALGLWPGGPSDNALRSTPPTPKPKPGRVSFLDVPHALDPPSYLEMWTNTSRAVGDLMRWPPDKASSYRDVAFVLADQAADGFAFDA